MTGKTLLLVVLLALGTGLVGGLIGVALFSRGDTELAERVDDLTARLEAVENSTNSAAAQLDELSASQKRLEDAVGELQAGLSAVEEKLASGVSAGPQTSSSLAVAYVDLTGLMDELFQSVQNTISFKDQELQDLRQKHESGEIDDETYKKESMSVEVELLAARLNWDLGLIDKMAASPEFSDLKQSLQELRKKLQPLQDQLDELKGAADQGDLNSFFGLYQQLSTSLQQLDQLVSQVIQAMLADITQEVAQAQGYALVLRKEDALYLDTEQLADLTPQVKARVPELFSP
ncbi:hypothetical protein J7J35_02015 [Candidatus Bipolaricaulota bacterium]|nr:hypothetical protein [Candidatus Bipolaricaulota bacterium]